MAKGYVTVTIRIPKSETGLLLWLDSFFDRSKADVCLEALKRFWVESVHV